MEMFKEEKGEWRDRKRERERKPKNNKATRGMGERLEGTGEHLEKKKRN